MKQPKILAAGALAWTGWRLLRRGALALAERAFAKRAPVVLITGGSRGLGLATAEQWAKSGARLAICARDPEELARARDHLTARYPVEVFTHTCDLTVAEDVQRLADELKRRFGRVDLLVNNAAIIEVGPLESLGEKALFDSIDSNLLSMIRMTFRLLPSLKRGARVVNITSIGAAVAVPHLLPYSVSKFGALGFSLGLDAELAPRGISVTSVLPGLMRTGSFRHARFRGRAAREMSWFSAGAVLPGVSISARSAARQIVEAALLRRRFIVLGPQAKLLRMVYQLFPNMALAGFRLVNRILPSSGPDVRHADVGVSGEAILAGHPGHPLTRAGEALSDRLNEKAG